jgi:hypothetical protein
MSDAPTGKGVQERKYYRFCKYCGAGLPLNKRLFCSRTCSQNYSSREYKRRNKVITKRYCAVCGLKLKGRQMKFCSRDCKSKFHNDIISENKRRTVVCVVCGIEFQPKTRAKTCSPECSKKHNRSMVRTITNRKRALEREGSGGALGV